MVSFQCHACGDVVKKPKLDQHRTRCHSGYDCIDCSTTFNSPAEYKGHTSCISEAEKYQKSLYKGPKTGAPTQNNNHTKPAAPKAAEKLPEAPEPTAAAPRQSNAQWRPVPTTERYSAWGRQTRTTGANDTPLGVNNRPDPSPKPVAPPVTTVAPVQTNGVRLNGVAKDNKRKSMDSQPTVEAASSKKKEKKSKKDKKDKVVDASDEVADADEEKKKKKKEKRKAESEASESKDESTKSEKKDKKKKEKKDKASSDDMDVDSTPADESSKKKEKKAKKEKKEKEQEAAADSMDVEPTSADDISKKKKKEKKDKKNKQQESTPDSMEVEPTPADESPAKKAKKEKKEKKHKKEKESSSSS